MSEAPVLHIRLPDGITGVVRGMELDAFSRVLRKAQKRRQVIEIETDTGETFHVNARHVIYVSLKDPS